jgi:hypothetical protein
MLTYRRNSRRPINQPTAALSTQTYSVQTAQTHRDRQHNAAQSAIISVHLLIVSGAQPPWPIAAARLAPRAVWRRLRRTLRPSFTAFAPPAPSGAVRCVEPLQRCVALLWPVRSPADVTRGFGAVSRPVARCVDIDRWMCVTTPDAVEPRIFFFPPPPSPTRDPLHGIPSSGHFFPLGHVLLIGSTGRRRLGRREGKSEKTKQ